MRAPAWSVKGAVRMGTGAERSENARDSAAMDCAGDGPHSGCGSTRRRLSIAKRLGVTDPGDGPLWHRRPGRVRLGGGTPAGEFLASIVTVAVVVAAALSLRRFRGWDEHQCINSGRMIRR